MGDNLDSDLLYEDFGDIQDSRKEEFDNVNISWNFWFSSVLLVALRILEAL
jgi:hypothetical protein